ncbi:phosphoglycerate mutase [Salinisphaera sp. PC39]
MLPGMTTLVLIRHGQASFGQANYDRLSELGERQAAITGRYLAAMGERFDAKLSGDMARQRVTGERAREAWEDAPALAIQSGFNEYDADGLFRAYLPQMLQENPELAARQRELFQDRKLFQRVFLKIMDKWLAGEPHEAGDFEPWEAFRQRVTDALAAIHRDYDRDARIAVYTSGGPIAVAVAAALGLDGHRTLDLNWRIHNAAITELSSNRRGWALHGFNNVTHLRLEKDPTLITYR